MADNGWNQPETAEELEEQRVAYEEWAARENRWQREDEEEDEQ